MQRNFSRHKGKLRRTYPKVGAEWEPDPMQLQVWREYEEDPKLTLVELAKKYGLTKQSLSALFKKLRKWKASQELESIDALQRKHERLLYQIFEEHLEAWERSKRNAVTVSEKHEASDSSKTTVTKGQVGDPRFLEGARAALEDIRKIRGANAPIKTEVSGTLDHSLRIVQRDDFYGNKAHDPDGPDALPAPADGASGAGAPQLSAV